MFALGIAAALHARLDLRGWLLDPSSVRCREAGKIRDGGCCGRSMVRWHLWERLGTITDNNGTCRKTHPEAEREPGMCAISSTTLNATLDVFRESPGGVGHSERVFIMLLLRPPSANKIRKDDAPLCKSGPYHPSKFTLCLGSLNAEPC